MTRIEKQYNKELDVYKEMCEKKTKVWEKNNQHDYQEKLMINDKLDNEFEDKIAVSEDEINVFVNRHKPQSFVILCVGMPISLCVLRSLPMCWVTEGIGILVSSNL